MPRELRRCPALVRRSGPAPWRVFLAFPALCPPGLPARGSEPRSPYPTPEGRVAPSTQDPLGLELKASTFKNLLVLCPVAAEWASAQKKKQKKKKKERNTRKIESLMLFVQMSVSGLERSHWHPSRLPFTRVYPAAPGARNCSGRDVLGRNKTCRFPVLTGPRRVGWGRQIRTNMDKIRLQPRPLGDSGRGVQGVRPCAGGQSFETWMAVGQGGQRS